MGKSENSNNCFDVLVRYLSSNLHEYIRYCFVATMTYWDSLSAAAICIPVMSPAKPETKILRQILLNYLEYSRVLRGRGDSEGVPENQSRLTWFERCYIVR